MRRPDASPTARIPTGNTPLRTRNTDHGLPPPNVVVHRVHKDTSVQRRTMSPNKLNATRKPFISPKLTNQRIIGSNLQLRKVCVNHSDRQAQFKITVSGETMQYCEKCAAQLASQGFKVERLLLTSKKERRSLGSNLSSKHENHPRAQEISEFLQNLKEVDRCFRQNSRSLMDVQNHYSIQVRQLQEFYNGIVCYVNYIRNQHVGLLKEESRKYVQIGLMEYGSNEENMEEIGCIVHDIQSQMESIVTAISEEQFRQCLNEYNKNLGLYRHKLEDQNETIGHVTDIKVAELQVKLEDVKRCLSELLGVKVASFNSNSNFSFEGSKDDHQAKRVLGKENNGPFRNLFTDHQLLSCPDESPQFKPR